eukprot:m.214110 g.214110  ORF g.214110 m.214110 type:complete len:246 (-) comp15529_c0_seq13:108-845(-)
MNSGCCRPCPQREGSKTPLGNPPVALAPKLTPTISDLRDSRNRRVTLALQMLQDDVVSAVRAGFVPPGLAVPLQREVHCVTAATHRVLQVALKPISFLWAVGVGTLQLATFALTGMTIPALSFFLGGSVGEALLCVVALAFVVFGTQELLSAMALPYGTEVPHVNLAGHMGLLKEELGCVTALRVGESEARVVCQRPGIVVRMMGGEILGKLPVWHEPRPDEKQELVLQSAHDDDSDDAPLLHVQ